MGEELLTRTCAACGFPALISMRRCPYCRVAFPSVRRLLPNPSRRMSPLSWLALAWIVLVLPTALFSLAVLGAPLTLLVVFAAASPAFLGWIVRRRTLARMRRISRRSPAPRPVIGHVDNGAGREQPPSDAHRHSGL